MRKPEDDAHTEILMDYIDGDCLEDVWQAMSDEKKKDIAQQLRPMSSKMRLARQRQFPIGACEGIVYDCRRYSTYTGGPFKTEAEFNEFILDLYKGTPHLIRNALAQSLRVDHDIVFTHGDITPQNIIVKDGSVQALIDWEFAGWYPEHWEYLEFFECATTTACRDWKNYAEYIFEDQHPNELVAYQALIRWQMP